MTTSGAVASTVGTRLLGRAEHRDDLVAVLGQDPPQPFPQQDRVLDDQDPHGSSTSSVVGPPGGLARRTVPSTAFTRSASPASPPDWCTALRPHRRR